jgi:misacylated tRNA(Ala) deacylase
MDEHCDAVERILKGQKLSNKIMRTQLRDLAQLVAFKHLHQNPVDPLAVIHREEGDNEYMNIVATELNKHVLIIIIIIIGITLTLIHFSRVYWYV